MRKSFAFYLSAFAFFALFFTACLPDDTMEESKPAPELPSPDMFIMSFDDFEDADTTKSFNNWFHAASNVVVWNVVIAANTIIPVAAFFESFNHDASFQGNNTWEWTYSYTVGNDIFNARLVGKLPNTTDVEWEMHIAKQGGFAEVLWYEGTTKIDRSEATWTLNRNANAPESFIGINYLSSNLNGNEQIQYTNLIPGSADNGDVITYIEAPAATYDANYSVFRIQQNNTLDIEWNKTTKDGRVKDPQRFGDDNWYCWDIDLQNVDCQ